VNILIFNCGSSSQIFKVYRVRTDGRTEIVASGKAKNVATSTQAGPTLEWNIGGKTGMSHPHLSTHRLAAQQALKLLAENQVTVDAVGHRFVHGGQEFQGTTRIDADTLSKLRKCLPLAPIHNPNSYSVIEVCLQELPAVPQYVVFDTAFHSKLPEEARRYALPREVAEHYGFQKYGFHGLSYQYFSSRAAEMLGRPLADLKLIICHLGTGGSSVAAIQNGHSIDTSMGYSPLQGLVMSTRCGDLDVEVALELVRQGFSADEISHLLNDHSGLLGLSGFSSNLDEIIEAGEKGNRDCQIAFGVYANRLKSYLGAYIWQLNGADAIVFTDAIGMSSWKLREKVCGGVQALGILLDTDANRRAPSEQPSRISLPNSRTQILLIPTNEEQVILDEILGYKVAGV
jgi:acetate kinase